jgi:D-glycero-alpha-D-manno-heptose 1-phosphate guanylyltransferase
MINEAIVLAGGFGTRLQSVVKDVPKPMAPVNNKPFLEYILNDAANNGINRCVLSVGYKSESIINHFGNSFKGIELEYAEEKTPLGTGGGLFFAMSKTRNNQVLVLNGDTRFDLNVYKAFEFHLNKKASVTICLKPMTDTSRYGTVTLDESKKVIAFKEKNPGVGAGLINAGVYIFNKDSWDAVPGLNGNFSLEKDFFEPVLNTLPVYGYEEDAYFIDIGIPEDYEKAQREFARI